MPKSTAIIPKLSAIILAGGKSRRIGQDKNRLMLGGQTLLKRSIQTASKLSNDIVIVTSQPGQVRKPANARVARDILPGGGALSGLHAGLHNAQHNYALAIACDMPFINLRLLRYMAIVSPGYDAVVPFWQNEAEPLHAIYARACLPAITELLQSGGGRIIELYSRVNVRYLEPGEIALFDPEGLSFFNINTPDDWQRAQAFETARGEP